MYVLALELLLVQGAFDSRSDYQGSGRRGHTLRALGPVLLAQGGQDDLFLKSAVPMHLTLLPRTAYSYPYSSFPRNKDKLLATPSDAINGGSPPSPQLLPDSMLLSMPPVVLAAVSTWNYVGEQSYAMLFPSNQSLLQVPQLPPASAWTTVGMVAGLVGLQVADSLLFLGGYGTAVASHHHLRSPFTCLLINPPIDVCRVLIDRPAS